MGFFSGIGNILKRAKPFAQLGRKFIKGAVSFGTKAQKFIETNPFVQRVVRALPSEAREGLAAAGELAKGALGGLREADKAIDTGVKLAGDIRKAVG